MSLLDVLRKGIKTADKIVKPLEAEVYYRKYVSGGGGWGDPNFPGPTWTLRAIVEWKSVQVASSTGLVNATRPTILFLDYAALMEATEGAGVNEDDQITLMDGTTGPIRTLSGFMDAKTGRPMYTEVYIG